MNQPVENIEENTLPGFALRLLRDVGSLEQCSDHRSVYFAGRAGIRPALESADIKLKSGAIVLSGVSRQQLIDAVATIYQANASCASCLDCEDDPGGHA